MSSEFPKRTQELRIEPELPSETPESYSPQEYEKAAADETLFGHPTDGASDSRRQYAMKVLKRRESLHNEAWDQAKSEDAQREAELRGPETEENVAEGRADRNAIAESPQPEPGKTPETPMTETGFSPIEIPLDLRGNPMERNPLASLNPGNQGFFNKMSEKGRGMIETLYEAPVIHKIVGKLGIAYNQFRLDGYAEKAAKLKGDLDILNLQDSMFDKAKAAMASQIEGLVKRGAPGTDLLALQLNDIDRQKEKLANEIDRVGSKLKSNSDKVPQYASERDRIADKLIGRYDEKLAPMEKELGELESDRDEMELMAIGMEENHRVALERLAHEKEKQNEILELARATKREGAMKKSIKALEASSAQELAEIRKEKRLLETQRAGINKKIADVDAEANPYRDNRAEFVRIKNRVSPEIAIKAREREEVKPKNVREIHADTRIERPAEASEASAEALPPETIETGQEQDVGRIEISSLINGWNSSLGEEKTKDLPPINRAEQEYLLKTARLTANFKVDGGTFRKLLERYYKIRKVKKDTFAKAFDTFTKKLELGK